MPIPSYEELERTLDETRTRLDKAIQACCGTPSAEQLKRAFDIGFAAGLDTVVSGTIKLAME